MNPNPVTKSFHCSSHRRDPSCCCRPLLLRRQTHRFSRCNIRPYRLATIRSALLLALLLPLLPSWREILLARPMVPTKMGSTATFLRSTAGAAAWHSSSHRHSAAFTTTWARATSSSWTNAARTWEPGRRWRGGDPPHHGWILRRAPSTCCCIMARSLASRSTAVSDNSPSPSRWKKGDVVWVQPSFAGSNATPKSVDNTMPNLNHMWQRGIVQEYRGSGWYTVQLVDEASPSSSSEGEPAPSSGSPLGLNGLGGQSRRVRSSHMRNKPPPSADTTETLNPVVHDPAKNHSMNHHQQHAAELAEPRLAATPNLESVGLEPELLSQLPQVVVDPAQSLSNRTMKAFLESQQPPKATAGLIPPPPTLINLDAAVQSLTVAQDLFRNAHGESRSEAMSVIQSPADRQYLQQVQYFMTFDQWVVFTDLHCSPSTLETTLAVLDQVHTWAVQRHAGILFLGDWWHQRGTLRVDCLNAVLNQLKSWTQPMIMIPGNHDQVTLGGHDHGLTPLENAYRVRVVEPRPTGPNEPAAFANLAENSPTTRSIAWDNTKTVDLPGILIFSHPTKFAKAVFIPHIRDHAVMESVLQSDLVQDPESTKALMVHADVTGAYMNDLIVSTGGVPPYMFPAHATIYSGHFHKPHVITAGPVSIEYLGSPYEVSLSEAQQPKALVVLDASHGWQCIERIPIQLGRRHFRVNSAADLCSLSWRGDESQPLLTDEDGRTQVVRKGDRVVLSIDKNELETIRREARDAGQSSDVDHHVEALRRHGVQVEIREISATMAEPMTTAGLEDHDLESLSAESTWKSFLEEQVRREAMTPADAERLRQPGIDILAELEGQTDDDFKPDHLRQTGTILQLTRVTIEGFGPFKSKVTYPLLNRGLVLLRGTNKDGGSDSNGTGKTSLAMSTLWALTGSIDPRPLEDSKVSDVVNDSSKAARVTVEGTINGVQFTITRTKTSTKSGLVFFYDGEDCTTQSAKETQVLIDEKLGISPDILARTMFHGQHALNELLVATDTKLKEELSLIVPLTVWQDAVTNVRPKARSALARAAEFEGMIKIRTGDLDELKRILLATEQALSACEANVNEVQALVQSEIDAMLEWPGSEEFGGGISIADLEKLANETDSMVKGLERERLSLLEEKSADIEKLEDRLADATVKANTAFAVYTQRLASKESTSLRHEVAQQRRQALTELWGLDESLPINLPSLCPTCHQPLDTSHTHEDLKESVAREFQSAIEAVEESGRAARSDTEAFLEASALRAQSEVELEKARAMLNEKLLLWEAKLREFDRVLNEERAENQAALSKLSRAVRFVQGSSKLQLLKQKLEGEQQMLNRESLARQLALKNVEEVERQIVELKGKVDDESNSAYVLTKLGEAFGSRGVQTYVLQNAVAVLESASQSYLMGLSDGAQRIQLSFDTGDRISRRAFIRDETGSYRERSLGSLSGGQWRRCSLALSLGFAELVSRRGRFVPSLCVFDEPLTHLDRSGRNEVGRLMRKILNTSGDPAKAFADGFRVSTVLMILQDLAAEELEESFDSIDEVVKENGVSAVLIDGH